MKTSDLTVRRRLTAGTKQLFPLLSKLFAAVLAQAGTAAPTATVLENDLGGTPTLARTGTGVYTLTLTGAWTANKVHIQVTVDSGATAVIARATRTSANVITINTYTEAGVAADLVGNLFVSIKVYS